MKKKQMYIMWVMGILLLAFAAGCHKKAPVAAAPPPKPEVAETAKPAAPTITEFTAEPTHIERGQSALLRWQVKDATDIEVNQGVGTVPASGKREIKAQDSTTYTLLAKGPGGTATAQTTLNVTPPPPSPPPAVTTPVTTTISERLTKEVQDAFFDYDRSGLREDARTTLTRDADALRAIMRDFPNATIVIEGHCDERGSAEYNLGLGDRRAAAAKDFLTQVGISADRLTKVSYGKEHPQCTESNEACWQKNRRVHFSPGENQQPKASSRLNEPGGADAPAMPTDEN